MISKTGKVIAAIAILSPIFVLLSAVLLNPSTTQENPERVIIRQKHSPFQSKRAYKDLETILSYGPRTVASEAAATTRQYLRQELEAVGIEYHEYPFTAETPLGKKKMVNVVAKIPGTRPGVILLGNHYDTKYFSNGKFIGANDGGATTAWMLECARSLGPTRTGRSLWLVWFDGEESFKAWSATDGIYGSRHFVEQLKIDQTLDKIETMINVDMIGDCYLRILRDRDAPKWLGDIIWEIAARLNYKNHFSTFSQSVQDDHIPFREAQIPTLELIDFSYGGAKRDHTKNWHTPNDTIERVCPESLQAIADVIYHALPMIEDHLNNPGEKIP